MIVFANIDSEEKHKVTYLVMVWASAVLFIDKRHSLVGDSKLHQWYTTSNLYANCLTKRGVSLSGTSIKPKEGDDATLSHSAIVSHNS